MSIRVVYKQGVFQPTEPVELPENWVGTVVDTPAAERPRSSFTFTKKATWKTLERFRGTLGELPEDPVEWQRRMRDEEWL